MNKILFLITNNDKGGAQDAIIKIATIGIDNFESNVRCIYDTGGDSRIKSFYTFNTRFKIINVIFGFLFLIKYIFIEKPKIVISFLPLANILNGFLSFFFRYKSIISHRNPVQSYSLLMQLLDKIFSFLNLYDLVTCNSQSVADSLVNYPSCAKKKIRIINNYTEPLLKYLDIESLENELNINLSGKYCLAVGRLSEQKRFDVIIQALRDSHIKLLIAGDGPLRKELKEISTDNVVFLGHLSEIYVKSLLHHCCIYLQPSAYEGQSNSLLEALQHSCIIISSDIPPQREVLTVNGICAGLLINSYSSDVWKQSIVQYIDLPCNPFEKSMSISKDIYSKKNVKQSILKIIAEVYEN